MADDAINKLVARCCQLERMEKRGEEKERERHSIGNFLITKRSTMRQCPVIAATGLGQKSQGRRQVKPLMPDKWWNPFEYKAIEERIEQRKKKEMTLNISFFLLLSNAKQPEM